MTTINTLLDIPAAGALLALLLIGGLLLAAALQKSRLRLRNLARSLLISYSTLMLILGLAEGYFRYVHADSGWGFTLAHKNWEQRYWQLNGAGFRDREWTPQMWQDKTIITVLGDSFAAGWGITNPADRFPDVLAARLGDDYAVINLAVPGKATPEQLAILQNNPPEKPDIVLLQYFLNDIEVAAASIGRHWEDEFARAPRLAEESYLVNFIYWAFYPLFKQVNTTFEGSYWAWEYGSYDDAQVWQIHKNEIDTLIDYVESINARLLVVIFPNMEDPFGSIAYVDRVAQVFEVRGHGAVLRLYDQVEQWDDTAVVVSPRDAHPSAAFHRYVGEELYRRFFAPDV